VEVEVDELGHSRYQSFEIIDDPMRSSRSLVRFS
jgi:hypothetical protein